jgi:hypothetical protein
LTKEGGFMFKQLTSKLLEFEADYLWINDNLKDLLKQYTNQWIAVKNGKIIANDPDLDILISKLENPAYTCVEFITSEPLRMVL